MANTYNPQRLRFVHDDKCYGSFQEILDYVENPDYYIYRKTVYAEPMIFKYGNEEKPNIVLAIGSTNGTSSSTRSNQIFFIDFAGLIDRVADLENNNGEDHDRLEEADDLLKKLIKACGVAANGDYVASTEEIIKTAESLANADALLSKAIVTLKDELIEKNETVKAELEKAIAKNKVNFEGTDTISWEVNEGTVEDGTVVSAKLKLPEVMNLSERQVLGEVHTENSLEIINDGHDGHDGLFLNVTVKRVNDKTTLWVNNHSYDISTNGKYVSGARYDYNTESIIFEYNNGDEPFSVPVEDLINEWKVLTEREQYSNGVILNRERVEGNPELGNQYADILTAKIHVAEDDLNMVQVITEYSDPSKNGVFVSKKPIDDEKERAEKVEGELREEIKTEKERAEKVEGELQEEFTKTIDSTKGELEEKIDEEVERAKEAEGDLELKVNTEIKTEKERAEKAERELQENIDAEIKTEKERAEKAERELQENIDAEKATLQKADETLQGNIDIEAQAREEADTALESKIDKLATRFGNVTSENAIVVDEDKKITLKINEKDNFSNRVLSQDSEGLAIRFSLAYDGKEPGSGIGDAEAAFIKLLDAKGEELSRINVSDFIMDGVLGDVELNQDTGDLTFTFNEADGKEKKISVNLNDYIQPYKDGDGIEITGHIESGVNVTKVNIKIDDTSEKNPLNDEGFLTVGHYGLKISGVKDLINATVQAAAEAENAARVAAYNDLLGKINDEETRATGIESTLQTKIDNEKARAEAKEAEIEQAIADAIVASNTEVKADAGDHTQAHLDITFEDTSDNHPCYSLKLKDVASENALKDNADNLAQEIKDRKGADSTLQGNIDSEVSRAKGVEDYLSGVTSNLIAAVGAGVDGSASIYGNGETKYVNGKNINVDIKSIDEHLQVLDKGVADAETHATNNTTAIENEASRAKTAEEKLQAGIDAAIANGRTELELNSEAETVEHLTLSEHGNTDGHVTYTLGLVDVASQTDITAEETARKAADTTLQNNIGTEAQTRENADNTLQSNIDAEQARAEKAEAKATTEVEKDTEVNTINHLKITKTYGENVQAVYTIGLVDVASENALSEEVTRAKGEEKTLTDNLANEVKRAKDEEASIRTALANAKQEAQTKVVLDSGYDPDKHMFLTMADTDDTYGQFIYTIGVRDVASASGLASEITRATGEEERIEGRLNDEIKRSTEKDADHDTHLTTLDEGLAAEITRAKGREDEIGLALTTEKERAEAQERRAFVGYKGTDTIEFSDNNEGSDRMISAVVKVFNDDNNVIKTNTNGIYANVTLDYDKTNNTLIFKNGTAGSKEISLSDHTLVRSAYYSKEEKAIILTVNYNGEDKDIKLPVDDLVESIASLNENLGDAIAELKTKDNELSGQILDINNSIKDVNTDLTLTKNDLESTKTSLGNLTTKFEKEVQDRQDGDTALTSKLNELTSTVAQNKADAGQALTEAVSDLKTSIGETNSNLSVLEGTVNNEIERSTNKDTEHDTAIIALQSGLNQEKLDRQNAVTTVSDRVSTLSGDLTAEVNRAKGEEGRIEGKVDSETTARQEADANLEKLITANTNKLNTLQETIESKTGDIASLQEALTEEITARGKDVEKLASDIAEEVKDRENAVQLESEARVSDVNKLNEKIMNVKGAIETTVSETVSTLQSEIESTKSDITAKMGTLQSTIEGKIDAAKSELQGKIDTVNTTLATKASNSDLNTAKSELNTSIGNLRTDLEGKINTKANSSDLNTAKSELQGKIDTAKIELQGKIDLKANSSDYATLEARVASLERAVTLLSKHFEDLFEDGRFE